MNFADAFPAAVPAPTVATTTYTHEGRPYVPHYTIDGVYVAPGGLVISKNDLIEMGAKESMMMLWER